MNQLPAFLICCSHLTHVITLNWTAKVPHCGLIFFGFYRHMLIESALHLRHAHSDFPCYFINYHFTVLTKSPQWLSITYLYMSESYCYMSVFLYAVWETTVSGHQPDDARVRGCARMLPSQRAGRVRTRYAHQSGDHHVAELISHHPQRRVGLFRQGNPCVVFFFSEFSIRSCVVTDNLSDTMDIDELWFLKVL